MAKHFGPGYNGQLPLCVEWRRPINKQLAHTTYARDESPREITVEAQYGLYDELRNAWRKFRERLPEPYMQEFVRKVKERKGQYPDSKPSEFRYYDLD